jgi:hypothetical protein
MANTVNDILTIIKLRGPIRSPELEEEIFADISLYTCYLESVCSKYKWFKAYSPETSDELAGVAYYYSADIIRDRWIEAEVLIATDPEWACWYATDVIKGRWPEAESVIATDPEWAYRYATDVIRGRWLVAEAAIATDRLYAGWYNEKFGTNI